MTLVAQIGAALMYAVAFWFALVGGVGIARIIIREVVGNAEEETGAYLRASALFLAIALLLYLIARVHL